MHKATGPPCHATQETGTTYAGSGAAGYQSAPGPNTACHGAGVRHRALYHSIKLREGNMADPFESSDAGPHAPLT